MRVIIIGCGKLGYHIAETFERMDYDVVVMDNRKEVVDRVSETLDVMVLRNNGLLGQALKALNLNQSDYVVATTENDEVNILICISAKSMGAGNTIARIRNPEYANDLAISKKEHFIDHIVNPEKAAANEVARLLNVSAKGLMGDFASGEVQLMEILVEKENPYSDIQIMDIVGMGNFLIAAISRNGEIIIPRGTDKLLAGDMLFAIGPKEDILTFCKKIGRKSVKVKKVAILGGGRIAHYLAELLIANGISVKVIEKNPARCQELAEKLPNALIIKGDGSDVDFLRAEGIPAMDAFISLTGMDEENIMISMLAGKLGVPIVISKVNRTNFIPLIETMGIDAAITPSMISVAEIMKIILGSKIASLSLLLGGQVEVMEFTINAKTPHTNIPIMSLKLPERVIITTIVRNGLIIVPRGKDALMDGDRVIILGASAVVEKVRSMFKLKEGKNGHGIWNSFKNFGIHPSR